MPPQWYHRGTGVASVAAHVLPDHIDEQDVETGFASLLLGYVVPDAKLLDRQRDHLVVATRRRPRGA